MNKAQRPHDDDDDGAFRHLGQKDGVVRGLEEILTGQLCGDWLSLSS